MTVTELKHVVKQKLWQTNWMCLKTVHVCLNLSEVECVYLFIFIRLVFFDYIPKIKFRLLITAQKAWVMFLEVPTQYVISIIQLGRNEGKKRKAEAFLQ